MINESNLRATVRGWLENDQHVIGPVRLNGGIVLYRRLTSADELLLDSFIHPANSIKEFVFPRHEKLYGYKLNGNKVELIENEPHQPPQIILAARPCDAASLPILDHVFNWDGEDAFYSLRRNATTVISLACREHDRHCFCTSVGLSPDAQRGSDAMLVPDGQGHFEIRVLTERGERLIGQSGEETPRPVELPPGPSNELELDAIRSRLAESFDHPVWAEASLRCLGCGTCSYTCPTCHCFDIVDERDGDTGRRVRNWDTCQFSLFTKHASGHNPREQQSQRQRQRVYHKFQTYPERFGELLCTGCGNCTRNCPVSLGINTVLKELEQAVSLDVS
jgi:ferredoxin